MSDSPDPELLPARMLNEWAYCPRLAMLEHLHGEWRESADTEDGHVIHARVDEPRGEWPQPADLQGAEVARSLWLSAPEQGITAKLDLVEAIEDGAGLVRPVDYKRGEVPDIPEGVHEPERVQLGAQAMVLRANGYRVEEGAIWFAASKRRVTVPITEALVQRVQQIAAELGAAMRSETLPPPLVDSPKCDRCSLAPLCLPDELRLLKAGATAEEPRAAHRNLVPAQDEGVPLHVTSPGARIGLSGSELVVKGRDGELGRAPLHKTSRVAVYGSVQLSTQAMRALVQEGTPVAFFSSGGWFYGALTGEPHGNVFLRRAQFHAAGDEGRRLAIVKRLISAKLKNQRTLLRRNGEGEHLGRALDRLERAAAAVEQAASVDAARGHEGEGAAAYFGDFATMLRPSGDLDHFGFEARNRRPPTDPVNALLSFAYSLLVREWTTALTAVGFDPGMGYLHTPRHGRPALSLDLMEEFRPILADSVVLGTVNGGEITGRDFVTRGGACNLNGYGRRRMLDAWERRLDALVTHPVFGYRVS